jgi:hypothetical protein
MNQLLNRILNGKGARKVSKEVSDPKEIGSGYIVCDVHKQRKPYDIVIQWVENGKLRTARIEDKSTEQSSVFEKTLQFTLDRRTKYIQGIKFGKANLEATQSDEDAEYWDRMFSVIPSNVKKELDEGVAKLIADYNSKLKTAETPNAPQMQLGDDSSMTFHAEIMDEVVKSMKSSLTKPFTFTIDMICQHFDGTHYLHIGNSFYKFQDYNPLRLKKDDGMLDKVDKIFQQAKATFQIKKREKRYSIILHVYDLIEKEDSLSHVVMDEDMDDGYGEVKESDGVEIENTMTLDELMHQQPS